MTEKTEQGDRQSLLAEVLARLKSDDGLAVAEFEKKRHLRVAPGTTLETFITELVDNFEVMLNGDRIVWNTEFKVARKAYALAEVEARTGSIIARIELKLPAIHDSHQ